MFFNIECQHKALILPHMLRIRLSETKDMECKVLGILKGMSRSGDDRIVSTCNPTCPRIMTTPVCVPGRTGTGPGGHPSQ